MDIDYNKMWNEIVRQVREDQQQEGEMSIAEFAKMSGLSRREAETRLSRLEKEGLVIKRLGRRKRCKLFLYKPVSSSG